MKFTQPLMATILVAILFFCSCEEEKVPKAFQPRNDHEAYLKSLENANLLETALGKDWQLMAKEILNSPLSINSPYEEAFYIDDKEVQAMGYKFMAKRGQKVQVTVESLSTRDGMTFLDLYRKDGLGQYRHVATAAKESMTLGFEPRRDAEYILRFQTELLRGGQYKITIENVPTLAFPVAGKTPRAIGSFWGDPRDGGRRKHEGVDIFARRGTPIVAPSDGRVRFAGERGIGGKVVWLRDSKRGTSLYFAHLNKILVKSGDRIEKGDTLGTVGNTGNARTTPPHLHFGVYSNGAVDPLAFLKADGRRLKPLKAVTTNLGDFVRVDKNTSLFTDERKRKRKKRLNRNQVVKTIAETESAYRIELPNGDQGYINKNFIAQLNSPLENLDLKYSEDLLFSPRLNSTKSVIAANESISLLGESGDFYLVRTKNGQSGWMPRSVKESARNRADD